MPDMPPYLEDDKTSQAANSVRKSFKTPSKPDTDYLAILKKMGANVMPNKPQQASAPMPAYLPQNQQAMPIQNAPMQQPMQNNPPPFNPEAAARMRQAFTQGRQ